MFRNSNSKFEIRNSGPPYRAVGKPRTHRMDWLPREGVDSSAIEAASPKVASTRIAESSRARSVNVSMSTSATTQSGYQRRLSTNRGGQYPACHGHGVTTRRGRMMRGRARELPRVCTLAWTLGPSRASTSVAYVGGGSRVSNFDFAAGSRLFKSCLLYTSDAADE